MRTQTSQKAELFARALRTTVLGVFAVFACALLLLLLSPTQTDAATSSTVNFQARLETASGGIVPDGNYNVEFKLFNAVTSSGSSQGSCTGDSNCLWTETRTGANQVRVANGYLTANLGSVTAFSGSMNWNQQLWLSMNIGGTGGSPTWDGEMSPRLLLTATPYAFQAGALGTTQGANVSTLSFATQTGSHAILLPDAAGTVCLQSSASCGFLTGSGSAFLQGGNSFGAQAVLGTNDNNSLAFRTNSSNRLVLDTSGNLQFQQASTINVASAATGTALTIQGGAASSGTNVGGNLILQGGAGASSGASGSVIVKSNTNNASTAFQVQNATGVSALTVDTTGSNVLIPGVASLQAFATNVNNLPVALNGTRTVSANGYIYVLGGSSSGDDSNAVSTVYYAKVNADGSTGTFSSANSLPAGRIAGSAFTANGYIYYAGGENSSSVAQSSVYYAKLNADGSIGTWITSPSSLPVALFALPQETEVANGYVYIVGGLGSSHSAAVYYAKLSADGSIGSWITNANSLPASRYSVQSVIANGYLYAIGGFNGSDAVTNTIYYGKLNLDGSVAAFSTNSNNLPSSLAVTVGGVINGYLYVAGGRDGGGSISTVYYARVNADGSVNSFSTNSNPLPAARNIASSVIVNGYLYVLGGGSYGSPNNTIYYSSGSRLSVGASLDLIGLNGGVLAGPQSNSGNGSSVGGSIYAGNIYSNGNLEVTGNSQVWGNSTVNGNFSQLGTSVSLNSGQDGSLGAFSTNSNALPAVRYQASAVAANGYIYVIGGSGTNSGTPNATNTVYYAKVNADGSTGAWSTNSNNLNTSVRGAGAVVANGYVYVVGGLDSSATPLTTVQYAKLNSDGSTGTWQTTTAITARGGLVPSVQITNGYLYVFGGYNSGSQTTVQYAKLNANGTVGSWSTTTALPAARTGGVTSIANGFVYYAGGFDATSTPTNTVYYAALNTDGTIGSWTTNGQNLPAGSQGANGGVMNGYLYVLGGNNGSSDMATVYYGKLNANGSVSAFSTNSQSIPANRDGPSTVIVNGYIYAIGGGTFASPYNSTVYYASGARVSIAADLDLLGLTSGQIAGPSNAGGNIYAGSIFSNGNLSIQGGVQIRNGLSVAGEFNAGGSALFQDATDSTTAFQIQNASAANLFVADTSDGEVGIGSLTTLPTTNTKLLVVSNVSAPTFAASANGVGIDLSAGGGLYVKDNSDGTEAKFEAFGSELGLGTLSNSPVGFWTNNGEKLKLDTSGNIQFQQASTINIASATTGRVLTIQGGAATSGTNVGGNLLLQGGAGASTGASGSVIVKSNTNNSTAAFAVQNASGNGVLTVDTSGAQVLLGKASTINGVLVFDNSTNGNTVTLQSGVTSASYALTLPTAVGSSGDCLKATNGTGTLGWGSCGGGSFVTLQGSTPGTADTGNFNITGTGIAGILQAGTLKLTGTGGQTFTTPLGNSKGTQINIPLYDPGAFTGVLTLGIPSSAVATSRVIQVYDGRSTASEPAIAVASPDENEVYGLGWNGTNNTAYLETTGSDSAPTIALSSNATTVASFGTGVATIYEGLTLSGTGQVSYVTPQGTSINTKVNIPNFNPGNFSQIQAMGLPSTAPTSARVITFFDQRASTHQPSIDLFSPDENQYGGLSWDGANTTLYFKSSQGIALSTGDANTNTHNAIAIDTAQATSFTPGNTTGDSLGLSNSTLSGGGANLAHLTFKNNNSGAGNTINGMQIDEQAAATPSSGTNTSNLLHLGGNAGGTVNGVDFYTGMTNGIKFDGGLSFTNYISSDNFTVTGGGAMTALGNALVKATSSTAFVVQNAGGTALLTADTSGTQVVVGSTSNGVVMSSTGFSLAGTARGTNTIYLNAEYAGAVLDAGSGSNNTGTMTSGIDLTNRMNYYKWTTTQATNQNYDVDVQVPLPANFSTWASNPLSITTYTSDTTNGTITLEARDSGGTVICNFVAVTPGSTTTWTTNNTACTLGTGTYTAGNYITLRIRLQSPQNGDVRVGNISLNYLANR